MSSDLSSLFLLPALAARENTDWETLTEALLNATHNGVFAVDRTGLILFSNQAVQTAFGLFPGTPLQTMLPEFWTEVRHTREDSVYRSGISVRKDGVSYLARVSPILCQAHSLGVLCIFEDITRKEQEMSQMLASQALSRELDAIINSSYDGLWVCDANATVLRINRASERINNVRAQDVVGRNMRELETEGLIDRSVTLEVIETRSVVSLIQKTRDGRRLLITGNPVFDQEGRLIRVVMNERDITDYLSPDMWPEESTLQQIVENIEQKVLSRAMEKHGSQSRTAEALGVNQSTIARKLRKYGMS